MSFEKAIFSTKSEPRLLLHASFIKSFILSKLILLSRLTGYNIFLLVSYLFCDGQRIDRSGINALHSCRIPEIIGETFQKNAVLHLMFLKNLLFQQRINFSGGVVGNR